MTNKRCYRVNNYSDFFKKEVGDLFTFKNNTFRVTRITWKGVRATNINNGRGLLLLPINY